MAKPELERFLNLSFYSQSSNTSKDPSPKIAVRMGVEKKVTMASRTATPAVIVEMILQLVILRDTAYPIVAVPTLCAILRWDIHLIVI